MTEFEGGLSTGKTNHFKAKLKRWANFYAANLTLGGDWVTGQLEEKGEKEVVTYLHKMASIWFFLTSINVKHQGQVFLWETALEWLPEQPKSKTKVSPF